ncbi:hypothetical protein [Marilutibacter spongiae]|uniref:hypothetical protein n=1 Tax=Marilutibacter spongiae TaxID=2025720 RepID=UPI001C720728|nr:hypothetical protein [Lysobacter spongiae]
MTQLFPKAPRRMKQPRKDQLREAVEALTDENIRLRLYLNLPWWRRIFTRKPQ